MESKDSDTAVRSGQIRTNKPNLVAARDDANVDFSAAAPNTEWGEGCWEAVKRCEP